MALSVATALLTRMLLPSQLPVGSLTFTSYLALSSAVTPREWIDTEPTRKP